MNRHDSHARRRARRLVRRALRWTLCLTLAVHVAHPAAAQDGAAPPAPPAVQELDDLEKAGKLGEAVDGWAERYLAAATVAERRAEMRRFVAASEKLGPGPEARGWLLNAVARDAKDAVIVRGRRALVVLRREDLGDTTAAHMAALLDGAALALERTFGFSPGPRERLGNRPVRPRGGRWRPPGTAPAAPEQPVEPDALERIVVSGPNVRFSIPVPLDGRFDAVDPAHRGSELLTPCAVAFAATMTDGVPNARAPLLDPALATALGWVAAGELDDPASGAVLVKAYKDGRDALAREWSAGCLAPRWMRSPLLTVALVDALGVGGDALTASHALLALDRDYVADRTVVSSHDLIVEFLSAALPPSGYASLVATGYAPDGHALTAARQRVHAEIERAAAIGLERSGAATSAADRLHAEAQLLDDPLLVDQLTLDALGVELRAGAKKVEARVRKLELIDDFKYLGPIPENWVRGRFVRPDTRLVPLAVARADKRRGLKSDEPVKVSLEWQDAMQEKDDLLPRTPWRDRKGVTWGGTQVAGAHGGADRGDFILVRPRRTGWESSTLCVDGSVPEMLPDGSCVAPGGKDTVFALVDGGSITCALPWRDADTVTTLIQADARTETPLRALRPWAACAAVPALPELVRVMSHLSDAEFATAVTLLTPFAGGDAEAFDALRVHVAGKPALAVAHLAACAGTRDAAVLDRVAVIAADDTGPEGDAARAVLTAALFRPVTESGDALRELWKSGRKWLSQTGYAEAESVRDPTGSTSGFGPAVDARAGAHAVLAAMDAFGGYGTGMTRVRGEPSGKYVTVRWRSSGAPLDLRGVLTDGKKDVSFAWKAVRSQADFDVTSFELPGPPKKDVHLVLEDPCVDGVVIDAVVLGPEPLE